jgi:aminopeptidase N
MFFTIISFLFGSGFAQELNHSHELSCSRAKFYKEFQKESKDVIQTPYLFDYDVTFYFLDIEVDNSSTYISGDVTFHADVVAEQLDTFAFELIDVFTIDEVLINDVFHNVVHTTDEAFVYLDSPIVQGESFTAKITYHGVSPVGGFFGTNNTNDWGKDVTWTLSEPFYARDWWPVKQVLEDKADSVWVFLTTDENNMAGSQGLLTNVTPMPDNKLRYEWKSSYPIDYYLISFAVSEYQEYNTYAHPDEMGEDSLLIQNFIYDSPGCLETYQDGMDATGEMIELYSNLFSLYPFSNEKYGHCLTALGGGMEHQTMTTIGGFSFGLVAHELGHMWFGDNITCATWSDIWINEGFATYSEVLAREFIEGEASMQSRINSIHNSVMSSPGGSTYVPPEEISIENVWRIFDGRLSYNKGAAILHMLRFEFQDDDLFFDALHQYTEQYAGSTATGADFRDKMAEVSGLDLTDFFDQWYYGQGYPTYSIVWSQNGGNFYFETTQTTSYPSATPLFKMLMAYKLNFSDGTDTTIYVHQTENVNSYSMAISKEINSIEVDPDNWVINHVGSIVTDINEENNPVDFVFGPNPVKDKLNLFFVNNDNSRKTIQIIDFKGSIVKTHNSTEISVHLDVSNLKDGTYIITATSNGNLFTKKFVKMD